MISPFDYVHTIDKKPPKVKKKTIKHQTYKYKKIQHKNYAGF
jgi:hypothetical protein